MSYDFQGSIAQTKIRFLTSLLPVINPGDNYGKVMIFVGESDKATYFVTPPSVDTITEVTVDDYATVTAGLLKTWLDGFFAAQSPTSVFLVVYTNTSGPAYSDVDLKVQFPLYTERAYFKLIIDSAHKMDANIALGKLCDADPLLSAPLFFGTNDTDVLTDSSGNEVEELTIAGVDAMVFYHPSATENPALVQLGQTLAVANGSGTFVGNKLDYLAVAGFTASGTAGANLTSAEKSTLKTLNVAYFNTIGDTTGDVAVIGALTLEGKLIGAEWLKAFIDFTAAVFSASYLTHATGFRNNATYQDILTILANQLALFIAGTAARLTNVKITAPPFDKLPPSAGDTFTVPNAWRADYVDNARVITVYGSLFITLPS